VTTKKEKELKKQEREIKKKQKAQDEGRRRRERITLRDEEREAKLKAFKSISNLGEAIGFVITYSGRTVLMGMFFSFGFLFSHFNLTTLIIKKLKIVMGL